jgi:hypothetical protein
MQLAESSQWKLAVYSFIFNIHLNMHEESKTIRDYMRRNNLDQATLAAEASVSQPTVSRALAAVPERRGRAFLKLLAYVGAQNGKIPPSITGKKRVARAFERIWDGSEAHAAVVAQIIEDLADLTPSPTLRRRHEQRKRA